MPHSFHEITQMNYRLLLLQLRQRGAPIAWATVMESCDVPNVTKPEGSSVQEQFYAEKEIEIQHMIRAQQIAQALGIDAQAMARAGGGSQPNGSTPRGGRPPTAQQAPQLKHKGDGRPTVSE